MKIHYTSIIPATLGAVAFASLLSLPSGLSAAATSEVVRSWYFQTNANTLRALSGAWQGWDAAGTSYAESPGTSSTPRLGHHGVSGWDHATNATDTANDRGAIFAHSGPSGTTGTFTSSFVVAAPFATLTDFQSLSLTTNNLLSLTWDQALSSTEMSIRVLVQVNNTNWYASHNTYTVSTASSNSSVTNAEAKTLDFTSTTTGLQSTNWQAITFGSTGITLTATQVANNLGDTITGIGFLIDTTNTRNRVAWIDNVELHVATPVPEPATWAALIGVTALLLAVIRKRCR
ncbi:PEP-CTERM sorting domain-containing protein [Geminisphaera colitermitum]|uniref:PEP-CTERM sorting domain-containing protein n=1 Tax=Geminisphaera colitermitum TaxID=1148786 RepID=UPI000158C9B9|nr:PEP-CTERM sorting domain-containing protein [Geminisphaera colitermitum]